MSLSPFFPLPTRPSGIWDEATTGRWLDNVRGRIIRSPVKNGLDYGLYGDGVQNDTSAFASAVAAAYGGALFLPAGTYMIDATSLTSGIEIFGEGIGKTILKARTGYTAGTSVLNTNNGYVSGIVIHDLTIDCNRANQSNNITGIRIGNSSYDAAASQITGTHIYNVRVTGAKQHAAQLSYQTGTIIDYCEIDDHTSFGIVLFRNCLDCIVDGNYVHSTIAGAYGIAMDDRSTDSTTSQACKRNVISNNTLNGGASTGIAIDVEGSTGNAVVGNTITGWGDTGIDINSSNADSSPDQSANFNTVSGNTITAIGASGTGINIEGSGNIVTGNILNGCGAIGILQQIPNENTLLSKNNVISGNTITTNTGVGILVYTADGLVITNNVVSDGSSYGIRLVAVAAASGGGDIDNVVISGNVIRTTVFDSISVESNTNSVSNVSVLQNTCLNWDTGAAGSIYGIGIIKGADTVTGVDIRNNKLIKTGSTGLTGVRLDASISNISMSGNTCVNLTTNLSDGSADEVKLYNRGNTWNQKEVYDTAAPATGTWAVGDLVWNSAPATAGNLGWVCTTAGTPGTWETFGLIGNIVSSSFTVRGANGQDTVINRATTLLSALSGATVTATNLIPAGSLVLGVTARVTTLITGATSFEIGDGVDADRWGTTIAVAANTTTDIANFTIASPVYYTAANNVVLTANGSNFTAGAVRLTVHYIDLVAATS